MSCITYLDRDMSTIGARLKQERTRIGLTQQELGQVGGVAANAQGAYEKGTRSPRADYLAKILTAGVDVVYVLTGKPVPPLGKPGADGISDWIDTIFETYSEQTERLASLAEAGGEWAIRLHSFCQNQLAIVATVKYLTTVAEVQGYNDIPDRVSYSLKALLNNALIVAEVIVDNQVKTLGLHRGASV